MVFKYFTIIESVPVFGKGKDVQDHHYFSIRFVKYRTWMIINSHSNVLTPINHRLKCS